MNAVSSTRVVLTVHRSVLATPSGLSSLLPSTIPSDDAFSSRRNVDCSPMACASEFVLSFNVSVSAASPRTNPGTVSVAAASSALGEVGAGKSAATALTS